MQRRSRGAFIVIEGLDRAGKTTQYGSLCEYLKAEGHSVKGLRYPDRTTSIGKTISNYLQNDCALDDHAIHLLFSANRWETHAAIEAAVQAGTTVVVDRYYLSGIVYSVAKDSSNMAVDWAKAPDLGLPKPDLVIFLDLDPDTAQGRGGYGTERYEKAEMQAKVRLLFHQLIKREDKEEGRFKIVDASNSIEKVGSLMRLEVDELFRSTRLNDPLRKIEP